MRLETGGLIDRARVLRFTFDGRPVEAHPGDTIASALMAADVRVIGRSFKYHRPRGQVTAGSDEPNALVTVGRGAAQRPNLKATMEAAADALEVRSQNAWPSRGFDVMAVNDLLSPFLAAGFYYKTFMWPRTFWERLYEPVIRRAAGLGRLSGVATPDEDMRGFLHCDLLVIGAGPAGLMAAQVAARAGLDVILADEDTRPGGRLLAEREEVAGRPGHDWAEAVAAELAGMPNVRVMPGTTVTGAFDQGSFTALQTGARRTYWRIAARRAVLAAGGHERGIAFPMNDRPGVMQAGALRACLNRWAVAPGRRIAVFGTTDDIGRTVRDIEAAGLEVAGVIDARAGAVVTQTRGRMGLRGITLREGGAERRIDCDALAVTGGWNPAVHLTCHMNGRPEWREDIAAFVPRAGAVPGLVAAGAANGAATTAAALREGAEAGAEAARDLGREVGETDLPEAEDGGFEITPFWAVDAPGRAWLDLQNDVTVKDVKLAARENFRSVEHMKRYTTQGMTTDQGKGSNVVALAVLADATGRTIPETGTTTFRPPYTPVPIAAMGAGAGGKGFAPERFIPSHEAAVARGAPMIEAGLWYRPSYFPAPGERVWRESCDREVMAVREAVGVADVSTLGKIEVMGPDAGAFLDLLYVNRMSSLKTGRVRYGLMLREDGHVMDDGTVARLDDARFLVTTTTAAAGQVMRHMGFASQVLRPDLAVKFASVTDHWAQFAVAGPRAREVLASVCAAPDLPFMGCGDVHVSGVAGRLFRISFSGELGFEIAVPSRFGAALWRLLVAQAETLGGAPYGIEALNVLRIEKGFLTHSELDGRRTAFDLGLQGMLKADDFIGRAAAGRPGLVDPERPRLVGLRPVGAVKQLSAGGFLFDSGAERTRERAQGHVTSVGFSPREGTFIGLGLLRRGPERHGERIDFVDHLRGLNAVVEVGPPCFYDSEGERMRG